MAFRMRVTSLMMASLPRTRRFGAVAGVGIGTEGKSNVVLREKWRDDAARNAGALGVVLEESTGQPWPALVDRHGCRHNRDVRQPRQRGRLGPLHILLCGPVFPLGRKRFHQI